MAESDAENPTSKEKKPRASLIEVANRVEMVAKLRLNGGRMDDVVALAAKENWGVSDRSLRDYVSKADAKLRSECGRGFRKQIKDHRAKRLHLYKIAMEQRHTHTAITILDSDAKLAGLFPKEDVREVVKQIVALEKLVADMEPRLRVATARVAELEAEIARRDREKTNSHPQQENPADRGRDDRPPASV